MKTLIFAIILTFGFLSDIAISSQNTRPVVPCTPPGWVDIDGSSKLNGTLATVETYRTHWDSLNEYAALDLPIPSISRFKLKALDIDKISVYPNPFSSTTSIDYFLPFKARVTLSIYDTTGKEVVFLNKGRQRQGLHNTTFIRGNLLNGVYDYKLILHSRSNKEVRSGILMIR